MDIPNRNILQLFLGAGAVGALLVMLTRTRRHPTLPLPPSPKSYPLIGHLLSMPQSFAHFGFTQLGNQLGNDIISLSFFGTTIVVTSSAQVATELLEKRSNIYSDRDCPPALGEPSLMNWGNFVGVVGYNETWRKYRRMMHVWLNKQAVPAFYQSQQHQARLLLQSLLDKSIALSTSEELNLEFYRMVSSTLLQSIYGYHPQSVDDVFVVGMKDVALKFGKAATPSNFMVNTFPALVNIPDWFPGTSWRTMLQEWGKQKDEVSDGLLNWTKRQIAAGNDDISMVASFLKDAGKWGRDKAEVDSIIKEVGVGLFGGGTETTVDTLVVFILAMLLFPEVQATAQNEIDGVVGTGRLPTMDDQPNLPYVGRLIQEVLRWQPVAPLGIPHVCSKNNEYQGYQIPKGAIVFGNVWAMSRDEKFYKDPELFDPDRYLETSVPIIPAFGWGRRICAGLHYANSSLFISIVSLLAVFDISMCKDETGQYIVPTTKCAENTLAYHPKPFKLKVTPRSDLHAELIRNAVDLHPRS